MYTYYWYLVSKREFPEFENKPGEWLLLCPDFPGICISDEKLDTGTWRNSRFLKQAKELVEQQVRNMYATGQTVPVGQKRIVEYFSFTITIPDSEPSSPFNNIE